MLSLSDALFILWILICIVVIVFASGRVSRSIYSRLMVVIFSLSSLVTIWFHETVIDISQVSPVHGAILVLAQIGTLTLTSKLWFSINYKQLSRFGRLSISTFLYATLSIVVIGSYWLYKLMPELQLLLYPFSGLAISMTAEILENRWYIERLSKGRESG